MAHIILINIKIAFFLAITLAVVMLSFFLAGFVAFLICNKPCKRLSNQETLLTKKNLLDLFLLVLAGFLGIFIFVFGLILSATLFIYFKTLF